MKLCQARVITPVCHLCLLAVSTYVIDSFSLPSSPDFWVFWYLTSRSFALLSFLLFFLTAFSDPGFVSKSRPPPKEHHHKQSSSAASHLTGTSAVKPMNPSTNTSALPNIIRIDSYEGSLSGRVRISISSEHSFGDQFYQLSEGDIPNLQPLDTNTQIAISKPIPCKPEPISPMIYSQEDSEPRNGSNEEKEKKEEREIGMAFCIVCHNDQPLRARHCTTCNECVAVFDHHCPFLGVCIGEKNKILFFWFIFCQLCECWVGTVVIFRSVEQVDDWDEWVGRNIKYVFMCTVSLLLALLLSVLWGFHVFLACSGITTWESMRWEKISYLAGVEKSPFSKGPCNNIRYFCKLHKQVTQWEVPTC